MAGSIGLQELEKARVAHMLPISHRVTLAPGTFMRRQVYCEARFRRRCVVVAFLSAARAKRKEPFFRKIPGSRLSSLYPLRSSKKPGLACRKRCHPDLDLYLCTKPDINPNKDFYRDPTNRRKNSGGKAGEGLAERSVHLHGLTREAGQKVQCIPNIDPSMTTDV